MAGVSQTTVSRLERGHLDHLAVRTVRRILGALEVRVELDVRWRGGRAEQLVDERHAALGVRVAATLQESGWQVIPEVSFQRYGERGSVDLLAARRDALAVCLIELKSAVHSYEETQRRLDVKGRLAPDIALERLGWRPRVVGVVLVVEDTTADRKRLGAIALLVRAGLPATSRAVRAWLARPDAPIRGLWFVRLSHGRTTTRSVVASDRVRQPRMRPPGRP